MKKSTLKTKKRIRIICKKRLNRLRRKKFREYTGDSFGRIKNSIRIKAPRLFTVKEDGWREILNRFLLTILDNIIKRKKIYIDFSETEVMFSDGTLYFLAFLDRVLHEFDKKRVYVRCIYPKNDIVEQVLQHVGLFDLLNKQKRLIVSHETVVHWRTATGRHVNGEKLQAIHEMYGEKFEDEEASKLYDGIIEAMTNSIQHAYPDDPDNKRWWVFSQVVENTLVIVFFDIGVGIPYTMFSKLEKMPLAREVLERFGMADSDGDLIKAAFEWKRSQTKLKNRGNGLLDLKKVLDERIGGKLTVQSGKGVYTYTAYLTSESVENRKTPIFGTLISWEIPLH